MKRWLVIQLLSDTTFRSGSLAPGEVDDEIEHDDDGIPYLSARRIEGLLREQWLAMEPYFMEFASAARDLLGVEGDNTPGAARLLRLDSATVPASELVWLRYAATRASEPVGSAAVLRAFTTVRSRHARDRRTGAPAAGALRRSRMLVRDTRLVAQLELRPPASDVHLSLLELLAKGVRHAGLGRNRGAGHLHVRLVEHLSEDATV